MNKTSIYVVLFFHGSIWSSNYDCSYVVCKIDGNWISYYTFHTPVTLVFNLIFHPFLFSIIVLGDIIQQSLAIFHYFSRINSHNFIDFCINLIYLIIQTPQKFIHFPLLFKFMGFYHVLFKFLIWFRNQNEILKILYTNSNLDFLDSQLFLFCF